jgi:tetratricopeptide (TPR) repeat protein
MGLSTQRLSSILVALLCLSEVAAYGQPSAAPATFTWKNPGGSVDIRRSGRGWDASDAPKTLAIGDSLRTHKDSAAELRFEGVGLWRLSEESEVSLPASLDEGIIARLELGGLVSRWRPPKPSPLTIVTKSGRARITGTEWTIRVDSAGTATVVVYDGTVELSNDAGPPLEVAAGNAGRMEVGKSPTAVRLITPKDRVQWVASYQPNPTRYFESGALAANAALKEADELMARGDFASALERIDQGQQQHPEDLRFSALRSRVMLFQGNVDESRAAAEKAVNSAPRLVDGWLALGDWGLRQGDLAVARRGFTQASIVAPDDARGWFGLGNIASDRDQFDEATRALEKALALDPQGPGYRGQLGLTHSLANQFDKASHEFRNALEQQPDDYVSLVGQAVLELKQGHEDKAIELLQRVTLFEPRYARAHLYLGVALYRQRQRTRGEHGAQLVDDAIREFEQASREDPNDPLPYLMLTQIYTDLYQPAKAITEARAGQMRMPFLKSFNQLANTVTGTANIGNAMAFLGLSEWADHLAHESYNPFWSGSHLFLADRYRSAYARFSEFLQGLLADPMVFGASQRFQTLLPGSGSYASAGAMISGGREVDPFWNGRASVNGSAFTDSMPMSYFLGGDWIAPVSSVGPSGEGLLSGALGLAPTPPLKLLIFGNHLASDVGRDYVTKGDRLDVGGSVTHSPERMSWFKVGVARMSIESTPYANQSVTVDGQLRQTWMPNRQIETTFGVEGAWYRADLRNREPQLPLHLTSSAVQAYGSARFRVARDRLLLQGDLFLTRDSGDFAATTVAAAAPRLGVAWSMGGGVVRAAYQEWNRAQADNTLAPVDTVGIPLDDLGVEPGGRVRSSRVQIEWPLSDHSFVVGSLTHSDGLLSPYGSIAFRSVILDTLFDVTRNASRLNDAGANLTPPLYSFGTLTNTHATVGEVSWNIMLSRAGDGESATSAYLRYQAAVSEAFDTRVCVACTGPIPGYARHTAVLGFTRVSSKHVYISGQVTDRFGLTDQWPANGRSRFLQVLRASVSWEDPDKRWSLEGRVVTQNAFDSPRFTAGFRRRW